MSRSSRTLPAGAIAPQARAACQAESRSAIPLVGFIERFAVFRERGQRGQTSRVESEPRGAFGRGTCLAQRTGESVLAEGLEGAPGP
jgi:hypothetical protein